MFVLSEAEDSPEVAAASTQNQLVGGDLHQVLTHQAHVQQLLLGSQRAEGFGEIRLKVIPFQIKIYYSRLLIKAPNAFKGQLGLKIKMKI